MLPEAVQACLNDLEKPQRREFLNTLAHLTERDGFDKAAASLEESAAKGLADPESLVTLHAYLNQAIPEDRMELGENAFLPDLPVFAFSPEVYDAMIANRGTGRC